MPGGTFFPAFSLLLGYFCLSQEVFQTFMRMKKIYLVPILFYIIACSTNMDRQPNTNEMKKIESAILEASDAWMPLEGVEGVAQGKTDKGKDCILVLVSNDSTAAVQQLPSKFKGFKVVVKNTGSFDAY